MRRRGFLKAILAAIVAPAIPAAKPAEDAAGWTLDEAIGVANTRECHLVVNTPVCATDSCIDAIADHISGRLNPGLKVRFELVDELWNEDSSSAESARNYLGRRAS